MSHPKEVGWAVEKTSPLLRYLDKSAFPSDESERGKSLLPTKESCARLHSYIQKTEQFKEYCARQKIPGQSPGRPAHTQKALERIHEFLAGKIPVGPGNLAMVWRMYRHAFRLFLKKEKPQLSALLEKCEPKSYPGTPKEFFEEICREAAAYDVSPTDIRDFYYNWGFQKIDEIENLIDTCNAPDAGHSQDRHLTGLAERVATLEEHLSELRAALNESADVVTEALTKADGRITEIENTAAQSGSNELQKTQEQLDTQTKHLQGLTSTVESLRSETKRLSQASAKAIDLQHNEEKAEQLSKSLASLTERLRKLEGETRSLAERFEKSEGKKRNSDLGKGSSADGPYRSPLMRVPTEDIPKAYKTTDELEFVHAWENALLKRGIKIEVERLLAYHCIFLANGVVLLDDTILHESWINCLGWAAWSMPSVASPAWVSEADWSPQAQFIFDPWEASKPKFASIHRYDSALVDCYLLPSLRLWQMKKTRTALEKLFLVADRPGTTPNLGILECAPSITSEHVLAESKAQLETNGHFRRIARANVTGVDPRAYLKWSHGLSPSTFDLTELEKHLGITVPSSIRAAFLTSAATLGRYFADNTSTYISIVHHVLPWVRFAQGDQQRDSLLELIKSLLGEVNYE